jgi:hypothetical protein
VNAYDWLHFTAPGRLLMSSTGHPHRPARFDISTPDVPRVFTDSDGNHVVLVGR